VNNGIQVIVGAGNGNSDACNYSPASATQAITVGPTMNNDQGSSFSNWGAECMDILVQEVTLSQRLIGLQLVGQ